MFSLGFVLFLALRFYIFHGGVNARREVTREEGRGGEGRSPSTG